MSTAHEFTKDPGNSLFSGHKRKDRPDFSPDFLDYHDALDHCLDSVSKTMDTEVVSLEHSLGRILRKDQVSRAHVPPWSRTMMDGFAIKTRDVRWATPERPVTLDLIDEVPAGSMSHKILGEGQAIRIMTGARVPEGADAVIRLEKAEMVEDQKVRILDSVGDNPYIIPRGHDMVPGSVAADAGHPVTPVMLGVLAACGIPRVRVSRKPGVVIIPTGSELVRPGTTPGPGQVYDINSHALFGLVRAAGAEPVNAGIVKDKSDDLLSVLLANMDKDLILLSGGVSVGDYDIVHETLVRAGVEEIFWRVKVKPGKPLFFGRKGKTLIFALPGNPVSSVVNFHLFVRPVIDKLLGKRRLGNPTAMARITNSRILKPGRRKFLRGRIRRDSSCLDVEILPEQRSGLYSPMLSADVLIEVPGHVKAVKDGDVARVHFLNGQIHW